MHRQNIIAAVLLVVIGVTVVVTGYAKGWGPLGVLSVGVSRLANGRVGLVTPTTVASETKAPVAPEFSGGSWINSDPLTLKSLRGRVVIVDFWTFGCYNCRNTLPYVKSWDARYRDKGLTIIGVHTPELQRERDVDNVRREVAALGIHYPVVTDNDNAIWNAYRVEAWPTWFVIDQQGRVRGMHVGEGAYDETEQLIKKLLAENDKEHDTEGCDDRQSGKIRR
ncbi:MAG TPA: redoxin domain-containing protein [Pyrinomonadaceae bacterium]|nr:redoxin domain-containing protein [Pyrinomonadaceae bacterium]